jgi:hypothetical protein
MGEQRFRIRVEEKLEEVAFPGYTEIVPIDEHSYPLYIVVRICASLSPQWMRHGRIVACARKEHNIINNFTGFVKY